MHHLWIKSKLKLTKLIIWKNQPHFVEFVITQGKGNTLGFHISPPCCHTCSNLWFDENTLNRYIFKNILAVMFLFSEETMLYLLVVCYYYYYYYYIICTQFFNSAQNIFRHIFCTEIIIFKIEIEKKGTIEEKKNSRKLI